MKLWNTSRLHQSWLLLTTTLRYITQHYVTSFVRVSRSFDRVKQPYDIPGEFRIVLYLQSQDGSNPQYSYQLNGTIADAITLSALASFDKPLRPYTKHQDWVYLSQLKNPDLERKAYVTSSHMWNDLIDEHGSKTQELFEIVASLAQKRIHQRCCWGFHAMQPVFGRWRTVCSVKTAVYMHSPSCQQLRLWGQGESWPDGTLHIIIVIIVIASL